MLISFRIQASVVGLLAFLLASCGDKGSDSAENTESEARYVIVERLYNRSCISCHAAGAAGAPRTFDSSAWKTILRQKDMAELVANVRRGYNAMPPMGLCFECSDEDFEDLIDYMVQERKNR